MRYAQIDNSNVCIAVSDLSGPVDAPNMIPVSVDEFPLGKKLVKGKWQDVPPVLAPLPLTFVQFFALAYEHGLTMEKYGEARAMPAMAIFFDMLQATNGSIRKDDPFTVSGAQAFVDASIITEQTRAAIFDNWPEG